MGVHVVGVDLRHDEGNVLLHAPDAAVVHDDAAALFRGDGHLAAHGVVGGYEREVAIREQRGRRLLDGDLLARELERPARGPGGGGEAQAADGEGALAQNVEGHSADCAGRADDGDSRIGHGLLPGRRIRRAYAAL